MSTVRTIDFVLRGKVGDVELTPRTIGFSQFNEFNQQVEAFIAGAQKANVHLRLRDTGQTVIVGASQDILRDQSENRVYRQALLRVKAEQHFKTGLLRNVHLIAFEDYAPSCDEIALNSFFDQGSQAWRDIPDAVAWVREQRGGG